MDRLAAKDEGVLKVLTQKLGKDKDGRPKQFTIDGKTMFWNMMRMSRRPDPWMFPALQRLRESGQFVLAALSNTIAFPDGVVDETGKTFANGLHDASGAKVGDIRDQFDVFISSAHVGLRKPDVRIYELAVDEAQKVATAKGMGIVRPEDTVFLDDIGTNLKAAKTYGMGTIKVNLGKTKDAVKELERRTGVKLIDESSRL